MAIALTLLMYKHWIQNRSVLFSQNWSEKFQPFRTQTENRLMRIGFGLVKSSSVIKYVSPDYTLLWTLCGTNGRLPAGQIPRHSLVQFSHRAQHEDVSADYILLHRRHITRSRRQIPSLFASASSPLAPKQKHSYEGNFMNGWDLTGPGD